MKKDILDAMFIPREAVTGDFCISMVGKGQLFVEGIEAVRELGEEEIKLRVHNGFLAVSGKCLQVKYFCDNEIMIKGIIYDIQFL